MPQEYIDQFLRVGSNTENHRTRIAIEYAKQQPMDNLVDFLEKTYHGGYGLQFGTTKVCAWYAEDGIHLAYGSAARFAKNAQILSWENVAARVGQLLERGQFATNVELAECGTFEKRQLAEQLWYMSHDISEKAIEAGHMSIVRSLRGGFPEETEKLMVFLSEPKSYQAIMRQVYAFRDACNADKGMMRFQMYHPNKLIRPLEEYTLPRREYVSELAELPAAKGFITEDEINEHLTGGSNFSGSKSRIHAFYQTPHTTKEKLDFLKNEYGIGGGNNTLSRNFMSHVWTDGKGIRYDKPNCTQIEVPWAKVVKYYDALMESGRFAPPNELEQRNDSNAVIDSEIAEEVPEIPTSEPAPVSEKKGPAVWEYNEIKSAHPEDIVPYQVGNFFEIYGEDAKQAAPVLDLHLGTRPIPTGGRVDMCGIPSHQLEQYTEKLRNQFDVTIAAVGEDGQRNNYSMGKLNPEPPRREITQSDIDKALQKWNGSIDSKRSVVRYMEAHARERDTAAWLAKEYGADLSQPLRITVTGADSETVLPWAKVQRRIAQLIKADKFYTEEEYDRLDDIDPAAIREQLADHGIVDGEVVDADKLDAAPIVQQVEADAQRISDEEFARDHLMSGESTFEIDGRTFLVDRVNLEFSSVNFQDITFANSTGFPIFRTEPISFVRRYIEQQEAEQEIQPVQPEMSTETVAVYPGEKNNLPYDIVVQTLRTEKPKPPRDTPIPSTENFRITDEDLGMGGAKVKFRRNMDAITTLKAIESEGRQATKKEQEILSRYVGWGGLADAFAEIKALCAGDPRIKERMDLDVEVSRLKIMKADHKSKQYRLEDSLLRHFPEQVEKLKGCIQAIQEDMNTLEAHPHPTDGFAGMTVLADELTDKDNAGAALIEAAKKATGLDPVEVGTYRGFQMSVTLEDFGKKYVLTMQGRLKHQAILGSDPRGNLIRLDNALAQMPQRLKAFQTQLDETCHQQEAAKAELGKPFPFEEELRDKTARLIFLDSELNLDANKGGQTEQVIAKSARPSVLDKLRSQPAPIRNNQKQKRHEEVR